MTERLAGIGAQLRAVRQVGSVVNAMRGLAGARAHQSRALLPAVRAYAQVATVAIAQALRLGEAEPAASEPARPGRRTLLVFGAEQGFAGAFGDRVLEAAQPLVDAHLLMIGARSVALARERGWALEWSMAMPARAAGLAAFAADVADRLYEHIRRTGSVSVDMLVPVWEGTRLSIEQRALTPLDRRAFGSASAGPPPLVTLPVPRLLERLGEEYVFARLCEAVVEAYTAENQARVAAMASARGKIDAEAARLQQLEHRVRQEEITAEVIELARRPAR